MEIIKLADILNLKRRCVVAMASFPPRKEGMISVISQLINQVDEIDLWLNEYMEIPKELQMFDSSKLKITLSPINLKDRGRYTFIKQNKDAYLFICDDDLDYPSDYVQHTLLVMRSYKDSAFVSYYMHLPGMIKDFNNANDENLIVHTSRVGSGVCCFIPSKIGFIPDDSLIQDNFKDLDFEPIIAEHCNINGIKMILPKKSQNYIQPLVINGELIWKQPTALFRKGIQRFDRTKMFMTYEKMQFANNTIIISNSCFGGHFDELFNRIHNNPFIYCSISSEDYLNLIENIDSLNLEQINAATIETQFTTTGQETINWKPYVRLDVTSKHIHLDFIHFQQKNCDGIIHERCDLCMREPEQYTIDCWNRRLARFDRNGIYYLVMTDGVRFDWTQEQMKRFKNLKTRHIKFFISKSSEKVNYFKNSSVIPIKLQPRKEPELISAVKDFISVKAYIDMNIINFVCTHNVGKDKIPFHLYFYNGKVVQGGSINNQILNCDFYDNDVYVSKYNQYINEMTVIYWIGKHLAEFNQKYIGLMHYRRGFTYDPLEFDENKIICSIQKSNTNILHDLYACHYYKNPADFYKSLPLPQEQINDILNVLSTSKDFYNFNMFIAERNVFKRYIDFISPIIEYTCKILDTEIKNPHFLAQPKNEQRFYGYCLERLTTYWLEKQRQNGITLIQRFPKVYKK